MQREETPLGFVQTKLPWIIGGAALAIFLVTLNHWVNLRSVPVVAKVAGWDWTPPVQWPLFFVLTYPFRWLPGSIQPIALNFFSALCGAVTLVLLARSVALLPHDRTHEQRLRERSEFSLLSIRNAWIPPVLAAIACGLQLTFWENASALSNDILDLLLFAYVVRCLLEFRVSQNERWLTKLAFVYGLGVTNNWAFIGFFPLMLLALIWIRGMAFFNIAFIGRMVLWGALGLLLYLLLPIVWLATQGGDFTLLQLLQANWYSQKSFLLDISVLRNRALLLSLVSILPVILMGIRWPSTFGDTSAAGASITIILLRVTHLFFLGVCLWVAFDPKFSPRALGLGVPFLSFYYLAALAIGYYSGFALLTFSDPPKKSHSRHGDLLRPLNPIVQLAVWAAVIGVPIGLVYKNFPIVQASNGTILKEFTAQMAKNLPEQPSYVLSEDPFHLLLLKGFLNPADQTKAHVLINTKSLQVPSYHEQLSKNYPGRWPAPVNPDEVGRSIEQPIVQQMIANLVASNTVVYLHPSFGYFFEKVYPVMSGQIYHLKPYEDEILPPSPSAEQLQETAEYWKGLEGFLERVEEFANKGVSDAVYVTRYYSRALNTWGVQLQRNQKLQEAEPSFAHAIELHTNNIPAFVNLEFNETLQSGEPWLGADNKKLEERFGPYRSLDTLLEENGQFDEPGFCFFMGQVFLSQSLHRQAIQQFTRVQTFQPTNVSARIGIAKALVYGNWPDKGLELVTDIRKESELLNTTNRMELLSLEAAAHYARNEFGKAEAILTTARSSDLNQNLVLQSLFELYRVRQDWTNAFEMLDTIIEQNPTNSTALLRKAELHIGLGHYKEGNETLETVLAHDSKNLSALLLKTVTAIQERNLEEAMTSVEKVLHIDSANVQALSFRGIIQMEQKKYEEARRDFDEALELQPGNLSALHNRALLNLRSENYRQAREDYETLRKIQPRSYAVFYGLAEVAYKEKDYEDALRFYESYLKYAPDGATGKGLEQEKKHVQNRLQEIRTALK